jgi:hypothetical protein
MIYKKIFGKILSITILLIVCIVLVPIIVSMFSRTKPLLFFSPLFVFSIILTTYLIIMVNKRPKRDENYGYIIVNLLLLPLGMFFFLLFTLDNFANGIGPLQNTALGGGIASIGFSITSGICLYRIIHKKLPIPTGSKLITFKMRRELWKINGYPLRCEVCESVERLEYIQIVPLEEGGKNIVSNIKLLCQESIQKDNMKH